MTVGYLFRRIAMEEETPTLLLDEVDALFKGRGPQVEDIRPPINAGHRRGAKVVRCIVVARPMQPPGAYSFAQGGLVRFSSCLSGPQCATRTAQRTPRWRRGLRAGALALDQHRYKQSPRSSYPPADRHF
jgi:hypothetical protein